MPESKGKKHLQDRGFSYFSNFHIWLNLWKICDLCRCLPTNYFSEMPHALKTVILFTLYLRSSSYLRQQYSCRWGIYNFTCSKFEQFCFEHLIWFLISTYQLYFFIFPIITGLKISTNKQKNQHPLKFSILFVSICLNWPTIQKIILRKQYRVKRSDLGALKITTITTSKFHICSCHMLHAFREGLLTLLNIGSTYESYSTVILIGCCYLVSVNVIVWLWDIWYILSSSSGNTSVCQCVTLSPPRTVSVRMVSADLMDSQADGHLCTSG